MVDAAGEWEERRGGESDSLRGCAGVIAHGGVGVKEFITFKLRTVWRIYIF